ncbi:pyridoxamine 5'-phosphate oxidase family protein [Erythrobacter sp. BLCC-B19]|uniref:pyridoxamine 5'-phosphate oxidase family protein n=1 Tax=Erythrobacter sp. BLCC-B19 TaxID=3025315 RepID=UPI002362F74F|nr:pyridoxamine 5'-phosphate oxidase family protein [Erythrobacter sp. BLCC-B19]WDA41005.1 pyridoxamine 5'-phosphate oxidase family protein [Erythrobacter sp. BLCC-B19]
MTRRPVDVAFTPAVRAAQARKGSRVIYEGMEMGRSLEDLTPFIAGVRSLYLATASAEGQPYIQHRGGPPGFLHIIGDHTLAFADFKGNRQFITTGNLAENPRAYIFLMDYARRQRIKIWGTARVIEGDSALEQRLMPEGYRARPEQVIVFEVEAWDSNCPQHIPQMFHADDVRAALAERDEKIAMLEAELAAFRAAQ